jgi:4-aminobutyrate aminotransferase-like enzyme
MQCLISHLGIDLERQSGGPFGANASAVQAACLKKNLLILTCGAFDTLRLIPALNISTEDLSAAMNILENALIDVAIGSTSKK